MIVPIRCFSCGKVLTFCNLVYAYCILIKSQVVGDLWERYMDLLGTDMDESYVFLQFFT